MLKSDKADILANYSTTAAINTKRLDYATISVMNFGLEANLATMNTALTLYWKKADI